MSKLYKQVCVVPISVVVGEQAKKEKNSSSSLDCGNEEIEKEIAFRILQAEHRAREILVQAEKEAEAIRKRAFEKGWQDGFVVGQREAEKEAQKVLEEKITLWERWFAAIRESRKEILMNLEEPILEFSFTLARKIIGKMMEREPFVEDIVRRALQKLSNRERVLLRVHQNDYVRVKEMKEELLRTIDGLGYLEIQEDPRVEEGGCIVETVFGSIDAQVDTQLSNLREEVFKILKEENHD
ncbi:MAG: FliH/SctL family protein [Candidatus Caldatribacteriaceae bacterium]